MHRPSLQAPLLGIDHPYLPEHLGITKAPRSADAQLVPPAEKSSGPFEHVPASASSPSPSRDRLCARPDMNLVTHKREVEPGLPEREVRGKGISSNSFGELGPAQI